VPGSSVKHGPGEYVAVGSVTTALMVFLSYIIVLNTVVPISLYVRYLCIYLFIHSFIRNFIMIFQKILSVYIT